MQNSRSLVRVFGGLNETYACSEAEYSAGVNFSARDFPGPEHPQAPPEAEGADRPERYVPPERSADHLREGSHLYPAGCRRADTVTCTEAVTDGKKALVGIGTKS